MRIFAAAKQDDDPAPRKAAPKELLRRLAFGRPQRRTIQPGLPMTASSSAPPDAPQAPGNDSIDLDQRVRQSGEW